MRALEVVRRSLAHLAAGSGHDVVDAVVGGMMEVGLVSVEHRADPGVREERQQPFNVVRVAVLGSGTERRMVAERDPPPHALVGREGLFDPLAMLGVLEQALAAEEALLRRIDADELDVAAKPEAIKEAGID